MTRGMASDEMSEQRPINRASNTPLALLLLAVLIFWPSPTLAADPTTGWASTWNGPGAATFDCRFPWKDCTPRRVTSLDTGRSIVTVPSQFCDCFTGRVGPNGETVRLIDLGPAEWAALGLSGPGLYRVRVELLGQTKLPDTATR